jgi:hypothetical protein
MTKKALMDGETFANFCAHIIQIMRDGFIDAEHYHLVIMCVNPDNKAAVCSTLDPETLTELFRKWVAEADNGRLARSLIDLEDGPELQRMQ